MKLCWVLSCLVPWLTLGQGGVRVGAAIDIFDSFGNLGAVFKVKGQSHPWIPDDVYFNDVFQQVEETRSPFLASDVEFNGDFLLQLCDNLEELEAALYLDHSVEGMEKPWRAYTGGWSRNIAAAHLGVNSTYLLGSHGYALVRLVRHHEQVMIDSEYGLHFNSFAQAGARQMTFENIQTVFNFLKYFGSHYISSYVSGDSLCQVFVFAATVYEDLQKTMRTYKETGKGLEQVLAFFTPWHAEHIGHIISLSGNSSLELWAENHLRSQMLVFVYSSLMHLHSAPELLQELNHLMGNDVILAINLKSLTPFIQDEMTQKLFREILDNHMKLWELSV